MPGSNAAPNRRVGNGTPNASVGNVKPNRPGPDHERRTLFWSRVALALAVLAFLAAGLNLVLNWQ